jgi:long-chain acyl-CoA synthetase
MFQIDAVATTELVGEQDRLLLSLPLHHVYPFVIGILVPLSLGLAIVLPASLTGPQLLRALDEGRVTVMVGVPRLYSSLYSGIKARFSSKGALVGAAFDALLALVVFLQKRAMPVGRILFRALRHNIGPQLNILASGGSPLDPELAWKLEGLGWRVAVGYGLTETSPLLTLNSPGSGRIESIGKAIKGVELRFDSSAVPGQDLATTEQNEGQEGELLARGPGVFSGYLNLPEKTEEAFTDGWFRTGDLGRRDGEGYLYLTGRASTLMVTEGGENIQPDHIEDALQEHPLIKEAGVLQKNGKLVALLVPEPAKLREMDPGEIKEAVHRAVTEKSQKMPSYQRITDFAVTRETLPRTRLGKIKRHLLDKRYEQADRGESAGQENPITLEEMSDRDQILLENKAARQTWQWLTRRYPDRRLTPDTSPQLDLGVDSMEWLNLTMEIQERVGVEITDEAIGRIEVIRDLLEEVVEGARQEGSTPSLDNPEEALTGRQKRYLAQHGPVMERLASCLTTINRMLVRLLFTIEVKGTDNIPEGQALFTPNHVSYLDPFVMGAVLDDERLKDTYWVGWTGAAFHNPLNTMVSRIAKTIPIDPEKGVLSSLTAAAVVLNRGKSLIWFPEGRRSPSGELQQFRTGIGVLLEHCDVTVVPVFIQGTREAMPVGRLIPRPGKIAVRFGEALRPSQLEQQGEGERAQDRIASGLYRNVAQQADDVESGEEKLNQTNESDHPGERK